MPAELSHEVLRERDKMDIGVRVSDGEYAMTVVVSHWLWHDWGERACVQHALLEAGAAIADKRKAPDG